MALLETLYEDFSTASIPTGWQVYGNFNATNNFNGTNYNIFSGSTSSVQRSGAIRTTTNYDSQNSSVYVNVSGVGTNNGTYVYSMRFCQSASTYVEFALNLGALYVRYISNNTIVSSIQLTSAYNASTHAYWRLRFNAAGTVVFGDTSSDGLNWTPGQNSVSHGFTNGYLALGMDTNTSTTTASSQVTFDKVNGGAAPAAAMSTLIDDFSVGPLDAKWLTYSAGGANYSMANGILTSNNAAQSGSIEQIYTAGFYNLINSSVYWRVAPALTTGSITGVQINNDGTGYLVVEINPNGSMNVQAFNNNQVAQFNGVLSGVTWDAINWRFMRFRMDAATNAYIERSSDASTWTTVQFLGTMNWGSRARFIMNQSARDPVAIGSSKWDSINTFGTPIPTDITNLVDQFLGSTLDTTKWTPSTGGTGSTITVTGGNLLLTPGANSASSYAELISALSYTIIGSALYARITPTTVDNGSVTTQLDLYNQQGVYRMSVRYYQGQMQWRPDNGSYVNISAYNSTLWAYWRIRVAANGATYVDRSADGTAWVQAYDTGYIATAANWPSARVDLYSQTTTAVSGTTIVDSVNVLGGNAAQSVAPTGVNDIDQQGGATLAVALISAPTATTDPESTGAPSVVFSQSTRPNGVTDLDAYDPPSAAWSITATAGLTDPEAMGAPLLARYIPMPDPARDGEAVGTPDVMFRPDKLYPDSVTDIGPVGTPSVVAKTFYTGYYSSGLYGDGLYGSYLIGPDTVLDGELVGEPQAGDRPIVATGGAADPEQVGSPALSGTALPAGIYAGSVSDPEQVGTPTLAFTGTASLLYGTGVYGEGIYNGGSVVAPPAGDPVLSNYAYGYGVYGDGPYLGSTVVVPPGEDPAPRFNLTYGTGTYGYGLYYGAALAPPPEVDTGEALPLFPPPTQRYETALHLLGIGPRTNTTVWRGAINYGIGKGVLPARPALSLPNAQSKGFTLRLTGHSEARAELSFARADVILIEEMLTDLWWRRRDPYTGLLEMIGRFNTSHVDISRGDTGLSVSCQFEDYGQILADRLLLRYLHPEAKPNPTTAWDKGTPIAEILAWALPKNTGIDITAVTGPDVFDLGAATGPFQIEPGTRMDDIMENLQNVSPKKWEWWVETPTDVKAFPTLMFAIGQRGSDKGVTLFDYGVGPTPIASWSRRAASDSYANSMYFTGAKGSVVDVIDAEVIAYGQRDVRDSDASVSGKLVNYTMAAAKRLAKYADRRPTFQITVKPGWWKGKAHVDVGDVVNIQIRLGRDFISEKYRVEEIQVDIDETGVETVAFTFGNPLPSANPRSKYSPLIRVVRTLRKFVALPGSDPDTGTATTDTGTPVT